MSPATGPGTGARPLTLTLVGGPTVLVEIDCWRILTDPTFDPPGRRYAFGWGTSSTKLIGPALALERLGPIDVVLLSHDHHADNLDDLGRSLLPAVTTVVTTRAGARRIRHPDVRGLHPGESTEVTGPGRPPVTITATPCRHGPPLSRPVAGPVIGFALSVQDSDHIALWMTGDTVLTGSVLRFAQHHDIGVMIMHLGRVRFPLTGPVRYSMDSHDAIKLLSHTRARVAIPVHYDGWSHFSEPPEKARGQVASDPQTRSVVRWLEPGKPTEVAIP